MKKLVSSSFLIAAGLFALVLALLSNASAQVVTKNSIVDMGGGVHRLVWDGVAGRTFFVQWSTDLMKWNYYPVIKNGVGSFFHQDAPVDAQGYPQRRFFFRLKHSDMVTTNAETADFDNDGLGNLLEVATHVTDPFNPDSDGDGLTDGWEVANGMDPNDNGSINPKNGPNGDLDGDGLSNLQEKNAGTNPNNFDSDFDGIADNVDTTPLANNAAANPDGENLPVGILSNQLIARFDYESVRATPVTNGAATSYADLSGNGWHAGIFNAGITAAGGGMFSKAAQHTTGHTLISQHIIKNKTAYSFSTWVKLDKDAIKNLPNTTVQMGLWGHHRYQNINTTTSIMLNGMYVHKKNATQEEWFLGSYLYSATPSTPLNGLFFTQPLGTSDNGEWLHITTTRNGNAIQIYFNGVLKASGNYGALALTYDANTFFSIGRLYGSAPPATSYATSWQGKIDRTLIHGHAITATEVAGLYNQDVDRDGLPDWWEVKYSLPPTLNSRTTSDFDNDELTDIQEFQRGTDPSNFDTDGDLLSDGWEVRYGLDPKSGAGNNGAAGNQDNDGMTNAEEVIHGSNPTVFDTDGDAVGDGGEVGQGSDPNNAGDGGQAPPADDIVTLDLSVGDHSSSTSERYNMVVQGVEGDTRKINHQAPQYGLVSKKPYKLRKGAKYNITIVHKGTDPAIKKAPGWVSPDYDYTALIEAPVGANPAPIFIKKDPQGILGVHDESDPFFAQGKKVELFIMKFETETVATIPTDRKRSKLGVGELVNIKVTPKGAGNITWTLTNHLDSKILPADPYNPSFEAATSACNPEVKADFGNGVSKTLTFQVVEPSGEVATKLYDFTAAGLSITPQQQGVGMALAVQVLPDDVSFKGILIRELPGPATSITGYFTQVAANTIEHEPKPDWFPLDDNNKTGDSAGFRRKPQPWTVASYQWNIPVR
jgi:Concanavalin A-like lectin/glucanases superfamily/Bacterial TSP3 repeat